MLAKPCPPPHILLLHHLFQSLPWKPATPSISIFAHPRFSDLSHSVGHFRVDSDKEALGQYLGMVMKLKVRPCSHPWRAPTWVSHALPRVTAGVPRQAPGFNPWVRKILWRRKQQPTLVFLPRKSRGQRSLAGCKSMGWQRVRHE